MKEDEIYKTYIMIKDYYTKYLKKHGVILPKLKKGDKYTKDALTLIFLSLGYPNTPTVTKEELTQFIRNFYPNINDVQQARHLAMQKGWYIISGTRGNSTTNHIKIRKGEYKLISLEEPHPAFIGERRTGIPQKDFEIIKQYYDYRCATCGSKEGEYNFKYPGIKTILTKAHMDPRKPLQKGNIIPQCTLCNRAYRNWWIFDKRGRIISIANPKVVERFDINVQKEIYLLLKRKFGNEL
jgi:hypothetical protein